MNYKDKSIKKPEIMKHNLLKFTFYGFVSLSLLFLYQKGLDSVSNQKLDKDSLVLKRDTFMTPGASIAMLNDRDLVSSRAYVMVGFFEDNRNSTENIQFYKKLILMKTMTCKQLGGACDMAIQAKTFREMLELNKKHCMEMYKKGDEKHLDAMHEWQNLMSSPDSMNDWFDRKEKEFDALPNID